MKRNLSQKGSRSGIRIGRRRKILVVYKERPKQSIQRQENSSIQQEYENGIQQEHQAHEQPSERIRKPTKPPIHYHTHYHFHTDTNKTPSTMPGHQRGQSSTGTPQNPPTMPAPPLPTDSTNGAMTMDAFINAIKVIFERDREREE